MKSPFLYPALSQRKCTRVLVLQPAENRAAQVVCSLTEVDLDLPSTRRTPYEALSYVWGSPVCNNEITCDGDSLLITESCLTALRYLRMKARTRTLWVDAICINQKSLEERNKQVALMGDIYKCAQRVLIWLGEASEASEQVLHQLRRVERLRIAMIFIQDFDLLRKLQRSIFRKEALPL
jgi:Heterokaryon incompatibility protein (HET)